MPTKTDITTQRKYIERTHKLNDEYQQLVAEQSAIFKSLPDYDTPIPSRVDDINKRIEAIKNTMQSNAVILADMLAQVLDGN